MQALFTNKIFEFYQKQSQYILILLQVNPDSFRLNLEKKSGSSRGYYLKTETKTFIFVNLRTFICFDF